MEGVRSATHVKRKGVIALLVVKTDDTIASFLNYKEKNAVLYDEVTDESCFDGD